MNTHQAVVVSIEQDDDRIVLALDEAARDITALLENECRDQGVMIVTEMPEASMRAYLPKDSMIQVLFNLLQNALEASPRGGEVRLSMGVAENRLIVSVADKGSGISEDVCSKVFEPFFTTKPVSGGAKAGLGLGLSISQGLVKAMGGSLEFESEIGSGTTFRVELPLGPEGHHRQETAR